MVVDLCRIHRASVDLQQQVAFALYERDRSHHCVSYCCRRVAPDLPEYRVRMRPSAGIRPFCQV